MSETLWVRPPGETWCPIGTRHAPGVFPAGIVASANRAGSDTLQFQLARAEAAWADLAPYSPVKLEVDGQRVWSGYLWEAVPDTGRISVMARGWQHHADDLPIDRWWVHARLSDWRDARQLPGIDLLAPSYFAAVAQVSADAGHAVFGWAKSTQVDYTAAAGIALDLGPGRTAARLSMDWEAVSGFSTDYLIVARGVDDPAQVFTPGQYDDAWVLQQAITAGPQATISGTFATPRRYLLVFVFFTGTQVVAAADQTIRVTGLRTYREASYESGHLSVLSVSDVFADLRGSGALPGLAADDSRIQETAFVLPELFPRGHQAPSALLEAANAYQGWDYGVDVARRLYLRPPPSAPEIEAGGGAGASFAPAGGSGLDLYDRVVVIGQDAAGQRVAVERTLSSPMLARQGRQRRHVLDVQATLTTTAAEQIGDLWLSEHTRARLRGTLVVSARGGVRRIIGGVPLEPHELLQHAGRPIRMVDRLDPNTGGWGWDGRIASVSYATRERVSTVAIDDEHGRLEALLERLALLSDAARR